MTDKKKRRKKKKAKKVLLFLLLIAIITGIVLSLTVFFKIETVTADGSLLYSENEITEICSDLYGKNIFRINKNGILNGLREKLPFVESIKLKRDLSGHLHVNVTDAVEYFCFHDDGRYFSASEKGVILSDYETAPSGMVEISAAVETPLVPGKTVVYKNKTEYDDTKLLLDALKSAGVNVTKIDVTNPVEATVVVENRLTVNFGTTTNIDGKVSHLFGMIKSIEPQKRGKINLSVWTPENHQSYFTEFNAG